MTIAAGVVGRSAHADVEAFYRAQLGRDVPLEPDQEVLVARDGGEIVGALRLCPEGGTLLLRTVVVADGRRGQGIGRQLLCGADRAIGARECWCFPWSHLERFYGAIGFVRVPDDTVPAAIRHRYGADCIATFRAASP
jgi:N-acetylglutamate synthase-like GNAT family acetyltransferase